jgi:hypothetical protein
MAFKKRFRLGLRTKNWTEVEKIEMIFWERFVLFELRHDLIKGIFFEPGVHCYYGTFIALHFVDLSVILFSILRTAFV